MISIGRHKSAILGSVAMIVGIALVFLSAIGETKGGDAKAVWLAGRAFATEQFDQIYFVGSGLFTMQPPADWASQLDALGGVDQPLYPFVYPPLWAWFSAHLLPQDLTQFSTVFQVMNVFIMLAIVWLSARICPRGLTLWSGTLISVGILIALPVTLAVIEMQPQIFVSFLILLALERHLRGADKAAGGVLALAAAIKLYPVLFALMFLARRNWAALSSFTLIGGALGALSIAVAGWPLHQLFLQAVSEISNTVLLTGASPNINAMLAHFFFLEQMSYQAPTVVNEATDQLARVGWFLMPRPVLWGVLQGGVLLFTLALCMWIAARATQGDQIAASWAALSVALVMLMPLSWFYYYLVPIFLQPLLFRHLSERLAILVVLSAAFVMSPLVYGLAAFQYSTVYTGVIAGGIWLFGYLYVGWPGRDRGDFPAQRVHQDHLGRAP